MVAQYKVSGYLFWGMPQVELGHKYVEMDLILKHLSQNIYNHKCTSVRSMGIGGIDSTCIVQT